MSDRADWKILKWFGHMVRMSKEQMNKKVYQRDVEVSRAVGRPCIRWLDGVKKGRKRWLELSDAKDKFLDSEQKKDIMIGTNGGMKLQSKSESTSHAK